MKKQCAKKGCDAGEDAVTMLSTLSGPVLLCEPDAVALNSLPAMQAKSGERFVAAAQLDAAVHGGDIGSARMHAQDVVKLDQEIAEIANAWLSMPDKG